MSSSLSFRQWLPVIGITACIFLSNTSEFMPMGLLSIISEDLSITPARTGVVISVYAWVVAIASLPLMLAVCQMEMRKLLLALIGFFAFSQFFTAFSSGFYTLMAARVCVACCHAILWSIATPIGARLVPEEHRSKAIGLIVTGASLATIVGQPLGRTIALLVGWRMTFASIGTLALIVLAWLFAAIPAIHGEGKFSLADLPRMLSRKSLLGMFLLALLFSTAYFTSFSYFEPFLKDHVHLHPQKITIVLALFGIASLVGSAIFSFLYNRFPRMIFNGSILLLGACQLLIKPLAAFPAALVAVCLLWGICGMLFNVTSQSLTIRFAGATAAPIAMSIYSGIFNVGIGSGTMFGGILSAHGALPYIGVAGAILTALAAVYSIAVFQGALKE